MSFTSRKIKDKLFLIMIVSTSLIFFIPFFFMFFHIITKGILAINWSFFTKLPGPIGEHNVGICNAIVGSFLIISMSSVIAIPWGIMVGVFLYSDSSGLNVNGLKRIVRLCIAILQSTPSIIIGILIYLCVVVPMKTFSAFSGSLALVFIMMPVIVLSTEESLNLIPVSIKEASLALGVPYYRTIFKVVIPSALRGIVSGILLGIIRISGETAPLIFTAFGSPYFVCDVLKPMGSLPLLIFNYSTSPYEEWHNIAWGAAFLLLILLSFLHIFVTIGIRRWNKRY